MARPGRNLPGDYEVRTASGDLAQDLVTPYIPEALGALREFDPDQPRDDDGKWTSEGGGSDGETGNGSGKTGPAVSGTSGAGHPRLSGGASRPYASGSPRGDGSARLLVGEVKTTFTPSADQKSALELRGATPLTFHELGKGGGEKFHAAISKAKASSKFGAAVTLYSVDDYEGMRTFLADDGKSGFALKGDDIISVFRDAASPAKKATVSMLALAVQEGGRRLDCFDTELPFNYGANGFVATSRTKFDDQYKPDGWNYDTFNKYHDGKPDVVFMRYVKDAPLYRPGDGVMYSSYDEAMAAQIAAVGHTQHVNASALFDRYHDATATADGIVASVPGASAAVAAAESKLKDAVPTNAPVAKGGFIAANGNYTPEREQLHQRILDDLFTPEAVKAATPAVGEKPVMTLLGGRGGSGKSWFTSSGIADAKHAIYINADDIQAKLPGYQGWNAALYHDEASDITKLADDEARELGVSVIHDATLRTPGGSAKRTADYKAAGYAVNGYYMFLPPQTSAKRAIQRFVKGGTEGRYVPASYLLNSTTNERSFDSLKPQFDKWSIYENMGASPKLVTASDEEKRNGRYSTRQIRERSRSARGRGQPLLAGIFETAPGSDRPSKDGATEEEGLTLADVFREATFANTNFPRLFECALARHYGVELPPGYSATAVRYNENHDPDTGQFSSGDGGGGSNLLPAPVEPKLIAAPQPVLHPKAVDVGGDQWNKETAVRLETEYQRAKPSLESIVQEGIGTEFDTSAGEDQNMDDAPIVPDEWDVMSNDAQEEAKSAYMKNTYDSYLESEVQNWQENGDALDQAKSQVANDFNEGNEQDWFVDKLQDYLDARAENGKPVPYTVDDLVEAITLTYQDGHEGNGDLAIDFDDSKLMHPSTLIDGQLDLPNIEVPVASSALSVEMRDAIEAVINKSFDKEADDVADKLDPPDYLSDSVAEYQEDSWDQMDGSDKFSWTEKNTSIIENLQEEYDQYAKEHGPGSGEIVEVKLPEKFDPLQQNDDTKDYRRTQGLATYLSLERQKQLMVDRKIDEAPDEDDLKRIDRELWEAWKGSSQSFGGQVLQVATADELGGRYRELASTRSQVIEAADKKYRSIGGFKGVKALVRAKWETSQYLLDKADIHTVEVFRGIKMDLPEGEKIQRFENRYQRIADAKILRNGAFSTTTDRNVANHWNGGSGNNKIVIRINAPRTSVVSVPAYGINVHSEHEVVVAGTAWKEWDAWKGDAPTFNEIPIGATAANPPAEIAA